MNSDAVYLKSIFEKFMIERGADAMTSISQAEAVTVDIEELTRKILALKSMWIDNIRKAP